jgi:hypothetical protein
MLLNSKINHFKQAKSLSKDEYLESREARLTAQELQLAGGGIFRARFVLEQGSILANRCAIEQLICIVGVTKTKKRIADIQFYLPGDEPINRADFRAMPIRDGGLISSEAFGATNIVSGSVTYAAEGFIEPYKATLEEIWQFTAPENNKVLL